MKTFGHRQSFSRPLLTVCVIFGAAFILATMGCGNSSSPKGSPPPPPPVHGDQNPPAEPTPTDANGNPTSKENIPAPVDPKRVGLCSPEQINRVNALLPTLNPAVAAIDKMGSKPEAWKKDSSVVNLSKNAERLCDSLIAAHTVNPCKKPTHTVVNPNSPALVYDANHLHKVCAKPFAYLRKFGVRQNQPMVEPTPVTPPSPPTQPPVVVEPIPTNPGSSDSSRSCNADEMARLNSWSASLDMANKNIAKLGPQSAWKYESTAISSAAIATKACESLISYHSQNACSKNGREYNALTLRERCHMTRTYFYDFVQNTTTLNFTNADLYLDMTPFELKSFEPGFIGLVQNCRIDNPTKDLLDYSNRALLVKDSRGFEDKIMVLESADGLLIQCYGLDLDGPFSKTQVMRLLKSEGSEIRLFYKLK